MVAALDLFSLKGKSAIITGGAGGIGSVISEYLASSGANVSLADKNPEKAREIAKKIGETYNVKSIGTYCEVTDETSIEAMLTETERSLNTPEILINNAGMNISGGALDTAYRDWKTVLTINLDGIYLVSRCFARRLVKNKISGSVVNIASMAASKICRPQIQTAYNTSKAAVVQLTKTLAVEWADAGIRVNAVSPGYIWTAMNFQVSQEIRDLWVSGVPLKRFGQPEEVAGAVLYFASSASSYATGSELLVDGGNVIV
jgi:NAD(P)-dependent dehydrogenase (short-subunit alcohol dehydrogenase family)